MKKDSAEILNQYEDFLRERELAENTIDAYTMSVRDFFSAHTEVTKQAGLAWKRELLEQGKKPQTVNVRLNAYNSLCEMLGMEGSKCKTIKIHQATAVSNVIPVSEYERLLRCLEQDKNWKWFYGVKLLAMTGARVSEYIRLQKKDFDRGYAEMWTKGKIRRIYIPKQFRDEAAAYYANAEPDDYLMPSRYGGQMSSRGVAEMLQKYAIKYGIDPKYMHPHSFRHLSAEAAKNGKATVQAFIDSASNMLPDVQTAYAKIGTTAANALQSKLDKANTSGRAQKTGAQATGTRNAEPGWTLVGEYGPEIVYMQGGEGVLNAAQTKDVLPALDDRYTDTRAENAEAPAPKETAQAAESAAVTPHEGIRNDTRAAQTPATTAQVMPQTADGPAEAVSAPAVRHTPRGRSGAGTCLRRRGSRCT